MKKHNSNLKIIASTSMCIFTLAVVFVATAAWFTAARNVDSNGDGFEVVSYDGLVKSITGHELDSVSGNERTYKQNPSLTYSIDSKTGSVTMTGNRTSLGKYDAVLSQSVFSFLYVITFDAKVIKNKSSNINIIPSTSTTEENSLQNQSLQSSDNPMSSIVTFSYGSSTTKDDGYSVNFTNINHEEFLTVSPLSYKTTLSGDSIDSTTITSDDEYYGFVYVSYETTNIEHIYSLNLGSEVLNSIDTEGITYKQDWKITIS